MKKKITIFIICSVLILLGITFGTRCGRSAVIYSTIGGYIYNNVDRDEEVVHAMEEHNNHPEETAKKEVKINNYLLFGIEEIKGDKNTDSMLIASVNQEDGTIKLTSLMRDSYVTIPGLKKGKLNAAYANGGALLLIETIEQNYKIHIDGYASVNFEDFEAIVDLMDGVDLELSKKEANYLNNNNYISNPENRNVVAGVNHMNGNQLLGYCRVRYVETPEGVKNDYGRTLRQRKALTALFDKVKSKSLVSLISLTQDCLPYVTTSLSADQISELIEEVVENKISTIETLRLPVDGMFDDPKKFENTTYPLVYDWDKNINELYQFIYGETYTP